MLSTSLSLSLALSLLLSPVLTLGQGQNSSSPFNSSYATQFVSALQSAGFTGLADALTKVNGTPVATQLFSQLSSGKNFTVFAPNNQAVSQIPSLVSSNASLLAEYISYHFVDGDFTNRSFTNSGGGGGGGSGSSSTSSSTSGTSSSSTFSSSSSSSYSSSSTSSSSPQSMVLFGRLVGIAARRAKPWSGSEFDSSSGSGPQPYAGVYPNVTLGRTLLNVSEFVNLPGNKSQVLAWTRNTPQGDVTFLNQATVDGQNITVVNGTTWRNLFINSVNGVFIPPSNFSTALTAINATALSSVLSSVNVTAVNGTNETAIQAIGGQPGITFFVPNSKAFNSTLNATLQGLRNDTSALQALVQNHYVNGTCLYSTLITNSTSAVSAAGEPFSFTKNQTGIFVYGANNTVAQIVRPDVLVANGVVHVVDQVLFATASNPSAASSFYSSATSSAGQSITETGPIGGIGGFSTDSTTSTSTASQTSST